MPLLTNKLGVRFDRPQNTNCVTPKILVYPDLAYLAGAFASGGGTRGPSSRPLTPTPFPLLWGQPPEIGLHGGLREGDGPGETAITYLIGSGPDTSSVRKNRMSREGACLRPWLRSGCWGPVSRFPTDLGGLFHLTRSRGVITRSSTGAIKTRRGDRCLQATGESPASDVDKKKQPLIKCPSSV
jgi:hypothetical protein